MESKLVLVTLLSMGKTFYFKIEDESLLKDDLVICVSSGVNLSAFVYYFTKMKPSNDNPWIQAVTCSPVLFSTDNKCF